MIKYRLDQVILLSAFAFLLCGFTGIPISGDQTPPVITISIPEPTGENGWYNEPIFVRVNALDGGSGVKIAQVSLGGKQWYPNAMRIALDGEFMVFAQAIDRAGNKATATQIIKIDLTPPKAVLTVPDPQGENGYYVDVVPLVLSGSDALSGVVETGIKVDGTHFYEGTTEGTDVARVSIPASGNYVVEGYVKDQAGNITTVTYELAVDIDAPLVAINTPMEFKGEIPLSGNAEDVFSGIRTLLVDYGSGWSTVESHGTQWHIVWPAGDLKDGEYPIRVKAEDHAGNQSIITYQAPILNTLWPFFALFSILISVTCFIVFDPRKRELVMLTTQFQQHNRMYQNGLLLGLEEDER